MNRRDFVKALAGIPLLGLLVKVPEQEEEFKLIMPGDPDYIDVTVGNKGELNLIMPGDPGYIDVSVSSPWHTMVYEGNRLISDDGPDYRYIGHKEPCLTTASNMTSGLVVTYWDGQEWIPMRVGCPRDWQYIGDKEPYELNIEMETWD